MWSFIDQDHQQDCLAQCQRLGIGLDDLDDTYELDALASDKPSGGLVNTFGKYAKSNRVYDVTAGMGRDSFLLALMGFPVISFERNALVALLLHQAMQRSLVSQQLDWQLCYGNCEDWLDQMPTGDILYFDPMFSKSKSAKPQKYTQTIQNLQEGHDPGQSYDFLYHFAQKQRCKLISKQPRKAIAHYIRKPYQCVPCGRSTVCLIQAF